MSGLDIDLARQLYGGNAQEPTPKQAPRLASAIGMPPQDPEPSPGFTSIEAERAVRASEEMDRASRAQTTPEMRAAGNAEFERGRAEMRKRATQEYLQDVAQRAYAKSQEASGFWENVGWQAAKAGKVVADGFVNTADLIHHGARGVGGMFSGFQERGWEGLRSGFNAGWEGVSRDNEAIYGTSSPSILDLLPESMVGEHAGQKADELIRMRLGQSELIGEGIGMVGSFILPGGPAGKMAQGAVRPLAGMVSRGAAKAALARAGTTGKIAEDLIESGNAWKWLGQNPGMRRANNIFDASLRAAGRNAEDLMTVGADAVARAYAVAPNNDRMHAAKSAAAMAPFMVPVARAGQWLGRYILERGVTPKTAAGLKAAYEQFSAGKIGVEELQELLHNDFGITRRALASLSSSMVEGTAFTGLQPGAIDALRGALAGDPDAMVKLRSMWLGNVLGTVGMRMAPGTPIEEFPFFRQSRPDLNRLETYLEAEVNKRLLEKAQEPKPEPPPEPPPEVRDPGEIGAREQEAQRTAGTQAETEAALNAEVRDPSEIAEQQERQQQYDAATAEERERREMQLNMRKRYGWASDPAAPLLRASWVPEFVGDTADVRMTYGRDHVVEMHDDGTLTLNKATVEALAQFGVEPTDRHYLSPDRIKVSSANARKVMDDLTLIGAIRRMQGDSIFERMGLREQEPGVWVDRDGNRRQMQLNGDSVTSKPNGKWTGSDAHMIVGRDAEAPVWDHPTMAVLRGWLMQKKALRPDPIVDELVGQLLDRAHYGQNRSAEELRRLIANTPVNEIVGKLGTGTDREVTFLMAQLGAGSGNAMTASGEMQAMARAQEQDIRVHPDEREAHMRALRGEPLRGETHVAERDRLYREALEESVVPRGTHVEKPEEPVEPGAPSPEPRGPEETPAGKPPTFQQQQVDRQRAELAAAARALRGSDETVTVTLDPRTAAVLERFVPQRSELGRAIDEAKGSGQPVEVQLPGGEFEKLAREWPKFGPEGRSETVGAVDAWLKDAADQFGIRPMSAETRSLADLLRQVRPGDTAETGSLNPLGLKQRAAIGKGVRGTHEFLLETQPEVLRKAVPGEKLPYEVRRVLSEGERLGDEFTTAFRPGEAAIRSRIRDALNKAERQTRRRVRSDTHQSPTNPEANYMRWRLLADQKVPPENPTEQAFVDAYQKAGKAAYEAQRKAGAVRAYPQEKGEPKYEGLRKQERSIVPYRFTPEFRDLLTHPDTRRETFEMFAGENPDGTMPLYEKKAAPLKAGEAPSWEYRGEGKITADALEALYQKELAGKQTDSALRESAAEHFRMLKNVPDVWKGIKILETDPFKAITGSLRSQGRRAAALQQFGPDIPVEGRRAMLEEAAAREKADPTFKAGPAVEALRAGRLGVEERLGRFNEAVTNSRALQGRNPETVKGIAEDLLIRAQGGQPEKLWDLTQSRAVQDFLGITNAFMASKGFVWDLGEPLLRTGAYAGYWKALKLMAKLSTPRNFRELAEQVDRWGAAERAVADHLLDELASSPAKAISDIAQYVGSKTERWKQVFNAVRADQIVQALKQRRGTRNDLQLLEDHLRISPEDMQAAREGRIDAGLETQLRRELTSLFTSRGSRAEGSRFAASRNAALFTRFNRFATRRLEQAIKDVTAVSRAVQRDGWASKEAGTAMLRLVKLQLGMAAGGVAGQAISYMLTSALSGENPLEGAARVWRELTYAPLRTTLKAFSTQLLGGPMGQLVNAAINNRDVKAVANTTIPGQLGFAAADFVHNTLDAIGKKDWMQGATGMLDAISNVGGIPFRGDVQAMTRAIGAASAGEDPQTVSDAQVVRQWKRMEKIQTPFRERNKPDQFYDSISKVLSIARSMPKEPAKAIVKAAMADLKQALSLGTEESVASAIEGHMLTKGLSDDDREKLHAFLGDDARITRVYQHDNKLKEFAAEVRKLEGTYPTPFQQQLEQVRRQAAHGGTDRWRPMIERVVDEAHQKLLAGDGIGSDIQDLADAMAVHSEQVAPMFKSLERYLRSESVDSTAKARRIAAVLRSRAFDRRAEAAKAQAIEKRKERKEGQK